LVVDDDRRLRDLLKRYLSQQNYRVTIVQNAAEARQMLDSMEFDLMVLDVMMPGENGLDLAKDLTKRKKLPILLLTAKGESGDRIAGLESGVDDYLTKPFEPRELVLRIQSILRRSEKALPANENNLPQSIGFGSYLFDLGRRELVRGEEHIYLTTSESALLFNLAARANVPISRDELVMLSDIEGGERAIDVQVTRLRRKIEEDPSLPRYLQTVRGKGYILKPDRINEAGK
jgi:two-component system phosphate regulon response regulator OmpR